MKFVISLQFFRFRRFAVPFWPRGLSTKQQRCAGDMRAAITKLADLLDKAVEQTPT